MSLDDPDRTTDQYGTLDAKLAIDLAYATGTNDVRGKKKQRERVWDNLQHPDGNWYCPICDDRIGRGDDVAANNCRQGQWHHPVKKRYFPAPAEVHAEIYSSRARKTKHHVANGLLLCTSCHGLLEGFENGRPHLMSWLCRNMTGQEIALELPAPARSRDSQRRSWIQVQADVERAHDYECSACGHPQQEQVTKQLRVQEKVLFEYTGRDVRAVHILPPLLAPEYMHDPANLVLLCWACLFGPDTRSPNDDPVSWQGWKDDVPSDWASTFAPGLYREFRDRFSVYEGSNW